MSCATVALIRGADYLKVLRVYGRGRGPRRHADADRAARGLLWRHREQFAEDKAVSTFAELYGRPSTDRELRAKHSRWAHKLMGYPETLPGAVTINWEALFGVADRSCPTLRGMNPWSGGRLGRWRCPLSG